MIGRADIEGSKSNVRYERWLPQASYPCGNFSDTSSFKFRRSKGSLGHAFTRCAAPQPNSPPDNVFRPDRPAEAGLGSKKRGIAPLPIHGIILSWLFDARGRPPKEPFPVRPPAGTRRPAPRPRKQLEQSADSRRVRDWDPRAQPSEPILFPSTTGPWEALGPSGFSRAAGGAPDTATTVRCSSSRWTLPPTESYSRVGRLLNRKDNSSRGHRRRLPGLPNVAVKPPRPGSGILTPDSLSKLARNALSDGLPPSLRIDYPCASAVQHGTFPLFGLQSSQFEYLLLPPKIRTDGRSAQAHAQGFAATAATLPTHRGLALAPTAGVGRAP
ncbi:hypothetical protein L1887_43187 [Cichorium endivia]|nr:hypothetical protein L1887_43187 [Cichorium endivia]